MNADYLMKMLNQIAANFAYEKDEDAIATRVAAHIQSFWSPRMKDALVQHLDVNSDDFNSITRNVVIKIV